MVAAGRPHVEQPAYNRILDGPPDTRVDFRDIDPAGGVEVAEPLRDIVASILGIPAEEIGDECGPATCGEWTSLRHVQIIAAVEDAFAVRFPPRLARTVRSVHDLRRVLAENGTENVVAH